MVLKNVDIWRGYCSLGEVVPQFRGSGSKEVFTGARSFLDLRNTYKDLEDILQTLFEITVINQVRNMIAIDELGSIR